MILNRYCIYYMHARGCRTKLGGLRTGPYATLYWTKDSQHLMSNTGTLAVLIVFRSDYKMTAKL